MPKNSLTSMKLRRMSYAWCDTVRLREDSLASFEIFIARVNDVHWMIFELAYAAMCVAMK